MAIRAISEKIGFHNLPAYFLGRAAIQNKTTWSAYNGAADLIAEHGLISKEKVGLVRNAVRDCPPLKIDLNDVKFSAGMFFTITVGALYVLGCLFNRGIIEKATSHEQVFRINSFIAEHSGNVGLIGISIIGGEFLEKVIGLKKPVISTIAILGSTAYLCLGELLPIVPGNTIDPLDIPLTFLAGVGYHMANQAYRNR